jgi:putative effector of murein hydrolase
VLLVAAIITIIDMPYAKYFEGAQFVHFLLGSATVALAVPIYKGLAVVRGRIVPLTAALLAGGTTSIVSAVVIARMLGADEAIVGGFYAKSVTAPIAMGIAERIHVSPTLTAVFAVTTGILGAVLARYVLDFVGARAWWQRGFALGLASHGLGVSRAFSVNPEAGTYASIAMGMHGIVGAVLIPLVVPHLPL